MKYGLIGEHLRHSFSKEIHELIDQYEYELKEIASDDFDEFMIKKNFKAINVTIPYKKKVIPYLDNMSYQAKVINSVNTIVNQNGKLYGYNTDYDGMLALIKKLKINLDNKKILILGTGGTSNTAQIVCETLNAGKIIKVSRYKKDNAITYDDAIRYHKDADIIINTTPCGMYPDCQETVIDLNNFNKLLGVIDVIYNPINTNLVIDARNKNIKAIGGLLMLVEQAIRANEIFTGIKKDNIHNEIYQRIIYQKENIVLIGMPSCGKTTIGRYLAEKLGKKLIDTDEEIKKIIKMEISDYFSLYNEEEFRKLEMEVVKEVSKQNNIIIATGGGTILKEININNLKHNGKIYFINRRLDLLIATNDRPLSSNRASLAKKYEERMPIYKKVCDFEINGNTTIESIGNKILESFKNENIST